MFRNTVTISAVALLGSCLAAPAEIQERACAHDNLYRCFVDTRYSTFLSAYCSGLDTFTSTIATVTATTTETALTTTVTASTETDSFSLVSTVYTATVPSATVTVTYGAAVAKRADSSSLTLPACAATYPAARLTSACACINVPAPTVSVTYTASTQTVTSTPTLLVTSTTSQTTFLSTVSKAFTSGVATVLVCPPSKPNLITNGGFDGGSTSGWQLQTTDSSSWSFTTVQTTGSDGQGTYAAQLRQASNSGFGNLQYRGFNLQNGINYKVGFVVRASSWPSATSFGNLEIDVCSLGGGSCSTSTYGLSGGTLVGNGWTKFEKTFTAKAGGASYLNLYASRDGSNPTYLFDNVYVIINC